MFSSLRQQTKKGASFRFIETEERPFFIYLPIIFLVLSVLRGFACPVHVLEGAYRRKPAWLLCFLFLFFASLKEHYKFENHGEDIDIFAG